MTETGSEDKTDRGVGYFSDKSTSTTFDTLVAPIDIKTYFHKDSDNSDTKLSWYKVNLASSVEDNADLTNICVKNVNRCKKVLSITETTTGKYSNSDVFSPIDSPRCELCFNDYIRTEDKTCVRCPVDGLGGNADEGNLNIVKGCIACVRDLTTTPKTDTTVLK